MTTQTENNFEALKNQIIQKQQTQAETASRQQQEANRDLKSFSAAQGEGDTRKTSQISEREKLSAGVQRSDEREMGTEESGKGSTGTPERERKTFKFQKAESNFEVDEDATLEFTADGQPMTMTLREMRDAAAGGVAVRNRMRKLAEEKKALQDPYKDFSKNYKSDPFNSLKKVFNAIQKVDPAVNFNEFIADLGMQAQNMAQMQPSERKALLAQNELKEVKGQLTEAQRLQKMAVLKEELIEETGLSEEKIFSFGQEILNNKVLSKTVKTEEDLMSRIGDLAVEVENQQASHKALARYKPNISPRDPLVFEFSTLLKNNPDFDEQDLNEIARDVLGNVGKAHASQRLSKKQRFGSSSRSDDAQPDFSRMAPVDALRYQIEAKKKQQITKR